MKYTNTKEAALKILITTANKHACTPKEAIDEAKFTCDNLIKVQTEGGKSIPGLVEYQTKYWTRVKQWLDRPDLTAF